MKASESMKSCMFSIGGEDAEFETFMPLLSFYFFLFLARMNN